MTMVERVARAIWAHQESNFPERVRTTWDAPHELGDVVKEMQRQRCRDLARAAIEAMREPTPFMLEHGDMVVPSGFLWKREHADTSGTEEVYRAMIDAALVEDEAVAAKPVRP